MELHASESGAGGVPVVLLHGFGGSQSAWDLVRRSIGDQRRVIAFDLPGHGRSLSHPHGSAASAARAVLADLERRGIAKAHLVGHSMGGAAAALAALMAPDRAASLTLLAPGGFGREVNHRLLRRYAAAQAEPELQLLLEQFFGWDAVVTPGLAAAQAGERRARGANAALLTIVETFFEADRQKVFAISDLAGLQVPVKVLWGTQDRVLPTRQAHKLPGRIAVHIFERAGHMLPFEIPEEVAYLVLQNTR
jgi:pyruvate dehydrogenase E2 component (dihydrolipoamide acetyltransferase)